MPRTFLIAAFFAGDAGALDTQLSQEVSAGGMIRVLGRDPGLIGGGNGGKATSVNYDDGNLNYDRGFTSFAVQGKSAIAGESDAAELRLEAVYFYDFVNADGQTDFHPLGDKARELAGRGVYVNQAYFGMKHRGSALRIGNQILRWSESASFGNSIAPVNPVSYSRRYQPGNTSQDLSVALPMASARMRWTQSWALEGFYLFGFKPTEPEAAGTFLSSNDYYSPGARYLQLGQGSPLVPDNDESVTTPATLFGSKVSRTADRRPSSNGQFGARLSTPELGRTKLEIAGYVMRVHSREPIVSVNTGTLGGLQRTTAPDYTSSGSYFVEYPRNVTVLGTSARWFASSTTRVNLDYSMRRHQPLQIDDDALITAGLAPAAATAACAPDPSSATCAATLASLNRNPVIMSRGGITAANAASFFSTELRGYERFNVSQYAASVAQSLPPALGARRWSLAAEAGGIYIHDFRDQFVDASVSTRPDAEGRRRIGLASRSAWGYRLNTRLDYADVHGVQAVSPSLTWIHDVHGNAPITLGTLLQGTKSVIVGTDLSFDRSLSARVSYRSYLGKGSNADRFSDRDFIALSMTKKF